MKRHQDGAKGLGFTLIEALIAISILSIVMISVSYFVTSLKKGAIAISDISECRSMVQTALANIETLGARVNVLPALSVTNDRTGASQYQPLSQMKEIKDRIGGANYFQNYNIYELGAGAASPIYNSHLILSSASFAQYLYNSNEDFCTDFSGAPKGLSDQVVGKGTLKDAQLWLNIVPFRKSDNSVIAGCPRDLRGSPSGGGAANKYPGFVGDADLGYRVT
ncbi:MAG: prepilin-type N-terminal cleavage/methylation domain-containing protein, partial [Bdellovibrionales bacterium]|nr:prepilin-type N-terminal cleavage/methylation domain-containing protein [Bdellovibrionales bacterium]